MARSTRSDWIDAGLAILREHGHDALTIDALCRALGRTKGSFYHHFDDAETLHDAVLAAWEAKSTSELIAATSTNAPLLERRQRLYGLVKSVELGLERAVQGWAFRDARARRFRARVDERRVAYLAELRRAAGVPKADALRAAQIEYAVFLGAMQVFQLQDAAEWRAYERANALLLTALDAELGKRIASSSS